MTITKPSLRFRLKIKKIVRKLYKIGLSMLMQNYRDSDNIKNKFTEIQDDKKTKNIEICNHKNQNY